MLGGGSGGVWEALHGGTHPPPAHPFQACRLLVRVPVLVRLPVLVRWGCFVAVGLRDCSRVDLSHPPFPLGAALSSVESLIASLGVLTLLSPSKFEPDDHTSTSTLIGGSLLHLSKHPLHVKPLPGVLDSLSWVDAALTSAEPCISAFSEATYTPHMSAFKPAWIDSATTRRGMELRNREPALASTVSTSKRSTVFSCEVSTAGNKLVLQELAQYAAMGMVHSLFPPRRDETSPNLFYATPPVGYGLVALPHVGYFVAVEWVGVLFATPVTAPFFLGSPAHKAAVEGLQDYPCPPEPVDVDAMQMSWKLLDNSVMTTPMGVDGKFYKLMPHNIFSPEVRGDRFRALHATYSYFFSLCADRELPQSLVKARLLYGQFAVLVEMPFVAGRDATLRDLEDPVVVADLATAIVWLAAVGLKHVDVRLPNIRITDAPRGAVLVDYDDMEVLAVAATTRAQLEEAYMGVEWWRVIPAVRKRALELLQ